MVDYSIKIDEHILKRLDATAKTMEPEIQLMGYNTIRREFKSNGTNESPFKSNGWWR